MLQAQVRKFIRFGKYLKKMLSQFGNRARIWTMLKFTVMLAKDGLGARSAAHTKVKCCDNPAKHCQTKIII